MPFSSLAALFACVVQMRELDPALTDQDENVTVWQKTPAFLEDHKQACKLALFLLEKLKNSTSWGAFELDSQCLLRSVAGLSSRLQSLAEEITESSSDES